MDRLRDIFIRATRFITALAGMIFVPLFVLGDIFSRPLGAEHCRTSRRGPAAVNIGRVLGTLCASLTNNAVIGMGHIRYFTVYSVIRSIVLGHRAFC